jgi:hypothetical protein
MFWRAIKNAKLLRYPELVLPFCLRLGPQKVRPHGQHAAEGEPHIRGEQISESKDSVDVLPERHQRLA